MSQTRASGGGMTSFPTALMSPSRITIVPLSITSPGFVTILPPTKAWTPRGKGRKPGGRSSALKPLAARERIPTKKKTGAQENRGYALLICEEHYANRDSIPFNQREKL